MAIKTMIFLSLLPMQVFKFGGASVKDADAVRNVASILKTYAKDPTIVVISAMGKTTNKLEELVKAYFYKEGNTTVILNDLRDFHASITKSLFGMESKKINDELENIFLEINWVIEEEPSHR